MIGKGKRVRFRWGLFLIGLVVFGESLTLMILAVDGENPRPFIEGPWVLLSAPLTLGLVVMTLVVYEYLKRKQEARQKYDALWRIDWVNLLIGLAFIFVGVLLLVDYCQQYCMSPVSSLPPFLTDLGLRLLVLMGGMFWFTMKGFKEERS
jgi:multisubunit Na+/H+ antiporter MnhB subunit